MHCFKPIKITRFIRGLEVGQQCLALPHRWRNGTHRDSPGCQGAAPVTFTLASSQPKTLRSPEGQKQKGPTFSSQTQRCFGREVRTALASLQGADLKKPESHQQNHNRMHLGVQVYTPIGLEALLLERGKEGEVVDRGPVCSSHQAFLSTISSG